MTDFDPIKAAREELMGVSDVLTVMKRREGAAELAMGLAEEELNAIRKLRGYAQMEVDRLRRKLADLEASMEAAVAGDQPPGSDQPSGPW